MDNSPVDKEPTQPQLTPEYVAEELRNNPYARVLIDIFLTQTKTDSFLAKNGSTEHEVIADIKQEGINASLGLSVKKPGVKVYPETYDFDVELNIYNHSTDEIRKLEEKTTRHPITTILYGPYASISVQTPGRESQTGETNMIYVIDSHTNQNEPVQQEFKDWFADLMAEFTKRYTESLGRGERMIEVGEPSNKLESPKLKKGTHVDEVWT